MKVKKIMIVTLLLLCLLMLGTVNATDDDTLVSSDVTKDTAYRHDNGGNIGAGQIDEKDDNPKTFDELRNKIENASDGSTITFSSDNVNCSIADVNDDESLDSNSSSSSIEETSLNDSAKNQTEVTSNSNDIYYNGVYSVTLKDANSSRGIANKNVSFVINEVNYAAASDSNGVASVDLSLNPGTYIAIAYFAGDDNYLQSNTLISTIHVLSTVKASDMTKYYKGTEPYVAKFYDSRGNALVNTNVVISVNGKPYTKKTDGKGFVSLAINLKPGTYKVTSTDPITGYQVTTTFKILSTISSTNLKKVKGDSKKFVAQFFKSNGKPLAKKYVKIKIKGKIHKVKTNSKGKIILSLKKFKAGKYKVVLYNKDGLSKNIKIEIYKIAKTKLTTDFYTFLPDDDKKIKVKLSTSLGGNSNSGKFIKVKINGKTYSKKTDSEGMAYLDAPSKKGLYTVEYSYKGNKFFKASKTSNLVTVLDSDEPKLTVKGTTDFGYGAGTPFKVALTAGNVPLAKRTVTFTVGGKTYSSTTDNKGIASIPINLNIGTYTVDFKSNNQFKIDGTNGSCSITVFKRNDSKIAWKCGSSYKDSSQVFKILLTDSNGNGVSGAIVELSIDGETYSAKTASNGYAKIKTSVALGKYKVSFKFKGSNDYLSSQASKSINVKLSRFGRVDLMRKTPFPI